MSMVINGTSGITFPDGSLQGIGVGRRNLIINGAMQVAQRGTQVTGVTTTGYKTCDRYQFITSSLGTWTIDQSTDSPDGFSNSLKFTATTADASPASGDYALFRNKIEGQDLQHLAYGASSAKTMTMSFWVKSNKTGTSQVAFMQIDNSERIFSAPYSISTADTWEQKTITIDGDSSGLFNNDNGTGLQLEWWLNSGSAFSGGSADSTWKSASETSRNASNLGVGGATSDYFAITGVQLEVGSVATPFEHRSFGEELALCQRYYTSSFSGMTTVGGSLPSNAGGRIIAFADSTGSSGDRFVFVHTWTVQMRASPTVVLYGNQWSSGKVSAYNGGTSEWTLTRTPTGSVNGLNPDYLTASGVSAGDFRVAYVTADAEL